MDSSPVEAPNHQQKDPAGKAPPRIRAVVFDYGNVVSLPQQGADVQRMASILGIAVERFCERYWHFRLSYDRAELSAETYWASVVDGQRSALNPDDLVRVTAFDAESWAHPNEKTLQWAKQLKGQGYGVALLSNMPLPVSEYLTKNCEWLSVFDQRVFSCAVRSAKPDAPIYKSCLDALKLGPEETLFLDDRAENVKAASELGIHGLVFDTLEHTSALAANRFGLPVAANW